jgi:hypothetical protein
MAAAVHATPLARLAGAFEDGTDLLSQAVAVLRAVAEPRDLDRYGVSDPAALPLGAADRALLAACERLTGHPLEHSVACPASRSLTTLALTAEGVGEHTWASVRLGPGRGLREPSYADLLACGGDLDALVARCRIGAAVPPPGSPASPATETDLEAVDGSLAGPLHTACVECGEPLEVDVDVVALALQSLAVVCADVDREVHLLASAYGWDLATIEALPDGRRQRLAALVSGVAP